MPAVGASSVNGFSDTTSTPCVIFGNMGAFAFGDKGEMRVAQFESGSFGGRRSLWQTSAALSTSIATP